MFLQSKHSKCINEQQKESRINQQLIYFLKEQKLIESMQEQQQQMDLMLMPHFIAEQPNLIPFQQSKRSKHHITKYFQTIMQTLNPHCLKTLKDIAELFQRGKQAEGFESDNLFKGLQIFQKTPSASVMCSKILQSGTKAFKCRQCMLENNSILCLQCFQKSDHSNHFYQLTDVNGGCCDCGDEQKWKKSGFCKQHHEQNVQAVVDQKKMQIFKSEMQFYVYLLFLLYENQRKYKQTLKKDKEYFTTKLYGTKLFEKVIQFNKNSMISNKMTVALFESSLAYEQLPCLRVQPLPKRKCIFAQLMMLQEVEAIPRQLVDCFTLLFQIKQFKKNLAEQTFHRFNNSNYFLSSEISNLTCQLFTSHRIVRQMIEQNKIAPISFKLKDGLDFQAQANIYVKYFIDLNYLANLSNGSAQKYLEFHIMNDDISKMGGYRQKAEQNQDQNISYWGLQTIMLLKFQILVSKIKDNSECMQKMIRDLYQFVVNYHNKNKGKLYVYLPQQRMLSLCIWSYLKGNIQILKDKQFCFNFLKNLGVIKSNVSECLKDENVNQEIQNKGEELCFTLNVLKIVKRVQQSLNVSALVISSQKYQHRYFTFFSFLLKKNYLILSLDFNLLNVFSYLLAYKSKNCTKIGDLIKIQSVEDFFNVDIAKMEEEDENYQRRKRLSTYVQKLALFTECCTRKLHQLTLSSITRDQGVNSFIKFYYSLHSRIGEVQLKTLKETKKLFFEQQTEFFQKYVKECTTQNNKKIKPCMEKIKMLLQTHESLPFPASLSYYVTRKKHLNKLFGQDKFTLLNAQLSLNVQKQELCGHFYTEQNVLKILKLLNAYFAFFKAHQKQEQLHILNNLLRQLVKIRCIIQGEALQLQKIDQFFIKILKIQNVDRLIESSIKVQIEKIVNLTKQEQKKGNKEAEAQVQQKKKRIRQIQYKKIQQLKQKQARVLINMQVQGIQKSEQNFNTVNNAKDQQHDVCLYCYHDDGKRPLYYLSLMQRSNQYNKVFNRLNSQRSAFDSHLVFSSCYHLIHMECFYQIFGMRDFVSCCLCKSTANVLLPYLRKKETINQYTMSQTDLQMPISRLQIINASLKARIPNQKPLQQQKNNNTLNIKVCVGVGMTRSEFYFKRIAKINRSVLFLYLKHFGKNDFLNLVKIKISQLDRQTQAMNNIETLQVIKIQSIFLSTLTNAIFKQNMNNESLFSVDKIVKQLIEQNDAKNQRLQTMEQQIQILQMINNFKRQKYYLPKQLAILRKQVGKCPNCSLPTNLIYICALCRWKGCQNCKVKKLLAHAQEQHEAVTVFIRVDTGGIVYLADKRGLVVNSLYQDFLGQSYKQGNVNRDKYILNTQRQSEVHQNIDEFLIQKVIRYAEVNKNKAGLNNIDQF